MWNKLAFTSLLLCLNSSAYALCTSSTLGTTIYTNCIGEGSFRTTQLGDTLYTTGIFNGFEVNLKTINFGSFSSTKGTIGTEPFFKNYWNNDPFKPSIRYEIFP